jgi:hypothetical protein
VSSERMSSDAHLLRGGERPRSSEKRELRAVGLGLVAPAKHPTKVLPGLAHRAAHALALSALADEVVQLRGGWPRQTLFQEVRHNLNGLLRLVLGDTSFLRDLVNQFMHW